MLHSKPTCFAVLHTSESLVAWCNGERALLHSQLVKLGELWRDSSRGRLWEWERRQGEKWRKWENTGRGGKTEESSQSVQIDYKKISHKSCDVRTSDPFIKVLYSASMSGTACTPPEQAAALGKAFLQSSGSGQSHNTQRRKFPISSFITNNSKCLNIN